MQWIARKPLAKLVVLSVVTLAGYVIYVSARNPDDPPAKQAEEKGKRKTKESAKTWEFAAFEERLLAHQNLTYPELAAKIRRPRNYSDKLTFDPTGAEFFDRVSKKLELTKAEIEIFKKNGFVSLDMNARHGMVSAYADIFWKDLPLLVTTDSILHALHRSFDKILMNLETDYFAGVLGAVLEGCREELKTVLKANPPGGLADNCKDVDLFLTVAINLLYGAAAAGPDFTWDGKLIVPSMTGSVDAQALELLKKIKEPAMGRTEIYGGSRVIDFTQFRPRGHYTKEEHLRRYFRAMMWLGRADTGWFILPVRPDTGIVCDDKRELRNSMLLVNLLNRSRGLAKLKKLDEAIDFLVGRSDNVTVFQFEEMLQKEKLVSLETLASAEGVRKMQQALRDGKHSRPMIVSLVLNSNPADPGPQVPAPAEFHMFGQRFAIDSFVFSQVVFDTIVFQGQKMERRLPVGLDAMVALGNGEALPLLKGELEKWQYSANLLACREFVDGVSPAFWKDSLYNIWLDSLRTFNADRTGLRHFPQAMKTQAWQRKELQTQLASWSELRHDTVLYVKQSYSRASCEYPAGYVEPYPEFYAKIRAFTDKAQELFPDGAFMANPKDPRPKHYRDFFKNFSQIMTRLENLANKELKAQAFTKEEMDFVKKTLISRPNCDGTPLFDGWYCQLFIEGEGFQQWQPVIVDVHTDPMTGKCLQVGAGETNLCVIAIDNEQHRRVYVGPIFSYYEFPHPIGDRLTDEAWLKTLENGTPPPRPSWVAEFQANPRPRALVKSRR